MNPSYLDAAIGSNTFSRIDMAQNIESVVFVVAAFCEAHPAIRDVLLSGASTMCSWGDYSRLKRYARWRLPMTRLLGSYVSNDVDKWLMGRQKNRRR